MKTTLRHILASNIREHRSVLGLSQAKLAEASNIASAYVAMIELEKKFPSVEVLERLANALQIDPTELFQKKITPEAAFIYHKKAIIEDLGEEVNALINAFFAEKADKLDREIRENDDSD